MPCNNESEFDVQKIQNLEEGWEVEWGRICEKILGNQGTGILFRKCCSVAGEDRSAVEDLVGEVCLIFNEKVRKQTLFANYREENGSVIDFLCSRKYLMRIFQAVQRKRHASFLVLEDEQLKRIAELPCDSENQGVLIETRERLVQLYDKFDSLVISCPKKSSRNYQQAGLQLYPRLSREEEEMVALHDDLLNSVAGIHEIPNDEADDTLCGSHRAANAQWNKAIEQDQKKLRRNNFRNDDNREKIEKKLSDALVRRHFCPIASREVAFLLKLGENAASQYVKRYREVLPEILGRYYSEYESICADFIAWRRRDD
ncbi:MAG: hypothetical protein Q4D38_13545 [Planctomycetia bacterium]|nr:hypothetical protein [Planctomycetia bacterium]